MMIVTKFPTFLLRSSHSGRKFIEGRAPLASFDGRRGQSTAGPTSLPPGVLSFLSEAREVSGSETSPLHHAAGRRGGRGRRYFARHALGLIWSATRRKFPVGLDLARSLPCRRSPAPGSMRPIPRAIWCRAEAKERPCRPAPACSSLPRGLNLTEQGFRFSP